MLLKEAHGLESTLKLLIITGTVLYVILIILIIWHNLRNHTAPKPVHKLNFKPTRKK